MKAMVIEDDASTNELFVEALGDGGFEAHGFPDAESAMKAFDPNEHYLITLDLGLPGMDGLEFCQWLRQQPNGEDPYVIAITGRSEPDDLASILKAGMDDYMAKPVTLDKLYIRLAVAEAHFVRMEKYRSTCAELVKLKEELEKVKTGA